MPVIDHLDPATKLIYLAAGVRSFHPVDDIYHEVRALRRTNEALRSYLNPVSGGGAVPKGGGKFTPRYAVVNNGWRIVPEDVSHTLNVTGEQLTEEGGAGPECFDFTMLSPGVAVIVNYEPAAAELIHVEMGSGLDPTQDATLTLIRKILQNRVHTNPANGVMTVFDDDDATPLLTASLYENVAGTTPYGASSQRIDRRNRLT